MEGPRGSALHSVSRRRRGGGLLLVAAMIAAYLSVSQFLSLSVSQSLCLSVSLSLSLCLSVSLSLYLSVSLSLCLSVSLSLCPSLSLERRKCRQRYWHCCLLLGVSVLLKCQCYWCYWHYVFYWHGLAITMACVCMISIHWYADGWKFREAKSGAGLGFWASEPFLRWVSPIWDTANPRTNNLHLRGFDSSIFLILRGGIPRSKGNLPETQTQRFLACEFLSLSMRTGRARRSSARPSPSSRPSWYSRVWAAQRLAPLIWGFWLYFHHPYFQRNLEFQTHPWFSSLWQYFSPNMNHFFWNHSWWTHSQIPICSTARFARACFRAVRLVSKISIWKKGPVSGALNFQTNILMSTQTMILGFKSLFASLLDSRVRRCHSVRISCVRCKRAIISNQQ